MTQAELRPMSVGEIIDGAVSIYRNNFPVLVAIALVTQGLPAALLLFASLPAGTFNPVMALAGYVTSVVGGLLAAGASVWVVSEAFLEGEPEFGDAIKYSLGRAWALFVAGFVKYTLVFIGSVFLFVPGIIVLCGLSVVSQVVVLEVKGGGESVGRSWNLTKGYKGKALILGFAVLFLFYLPTMVATVLAVVVPSLTTLLTVAGQVVALLLYPIVICTFTLYYYDLRVRKEAFDLEILGRELTREFEVPA